MSDKISSVERDLAILLSENQRLFQENKKMKQQIKELKSEKLDLISRLNLMIIVMEDGKELKVKTKSVLRAIKNERIGL